MSRRDRDRRDENLSCKVYCGGLGEDPPRKEDLEDEFSYYGKLRSVWVARSPPGFAYIEFEDGRDAEDSCKGLDGKRICGKTVKVEMSHGRRMPKPWDRRSRSHSRSRGRRYRSRSRSRSNSRRHRRERTPSRSRSRSRSRGRGRSR